MSQGSTGLVFVINLKQCLICGIQNTDGNSSLRLHEIGRGSQSYRAKSKREQIMREDRRGWNRSVLPPTAVPRVDLAPADDTQPN